MERPKEQAKRSRAERAVVANAGAAERLMGRARSSRAFNPLFGRISPLFSRQRRFSFNPLNLQEV